MVLRIVLCLVLQKFHDASVCPAAQPIAQNGSSVNATPASHYLSPFCNLLFLFNIVVTIVPVMYFQTDSSSSLRLCPAVMRPRYFHSPTFPSPTSKTLITPIQCPQHRSLVSSISSSNNKLSSSFRTFFVTRRNRYSPLMPNIPQISVPANARPTIK